MDSGMRYLLELQRLDSRIAEIGKLRERIPQEITRLNEELEAEKRRLEQAREELNSLKLRRRRKEKDLEVETEKLRKAQGRIFEVKTNKEYQALLKEIEAAKKANSDLEEEILLLMDEMDRRTEELKSLEVEVAEREATISARKKELEEKMAKLDSEEAKVQLLRKEVASRIEPPWMGIYERVAKSRGGLAVVKVDGGICQGCYVNIPPQLYNEILKGKPMAQCPFCQRFLYHEGTLEEHD